MGWFLRGIGDLGSQAGEGYGIAQDWKLKQQKAQLEAARAAMEQQLLPLQLEEMRARIKKLGQPEQKFLTTESGGTDVVDIDPVTGVGKPRELLPGKKKSLREQYEEETDPEKRKSLAAQIKEETEATSHRTPMQDAQEDLMRAQATGSPIAIKTAEDKLRQLAGASKPEGAPTYWKLRMAALHGDADAIAALAEDEKMQEARLRARGLAFGQGRMFQMRTYINGQGGSEDMTGFEYERRKAAGEPLTPTGRLNENTAIAYQKTKNEVAPALANVEKDLGAFDNPGDRAIFAKILKGAGEPQHGYEFPWMQNILKQALAEGLSEQGRDLTINLNRLAEVMGPLRQSLGLPSTEQSMLLTLSLLPGPMTPDARYARSQLVSLRNIFDQALNVPLMQNVMPGAGGPGGPPPGAKVITLDQLFGAH